MQRSLNFLKVNLKPITHLIIDWIARLNMNSIFRFMRITTEIAKVLTEIVIILTEIPKTQNVAFKSTLR